MTAADVAAVGLLFAILGGQWIGQGVATLLRLDQPRRPRRRAL